MCERDDRTPGEAYFEEAIEPRETLIAEAEEDIAEERRRDEYDYGYRPGDPEPSWQREACFGRSCALWAAGAPHKCDIGKCEKFWSRHRQWEAAQKADGR